MSKYLNALFEFEEALSTKNTKGLLRPFKELIDIGSERKENLTNNPAITVYIPQKVKNLRSEKNILIILHELSRTGAPVITIDAVKALIKNHFFVTVVTMRRGPLLKELLECGVPVIFNREIPLTYDSKNIIRGKNNHMLMDTFLESFDLTIMVTAVHHNLIQRYAHSQKPILWWLHEGTATYDWLSISMPKQVGPHIKVYAGGKYAQEQLEKYNLHYNAQILNYGVIDTFKSTKRQEPKNQTVKFILPGSIGTRKGQAILLNAIYNLPKSYLKKSEFIFVGDILSKADLDGRNIKKQIIATSKSMSNIKYFPSISREKLFDIYKKIDILTLPSIDDPMPVVATEALMMGKVVLCSDATGTSYYIKDKQNGFVFKSEDALELRDKIMYIIDHRHALLTIGRRGRKIYEENFKMHVFEKKLIHIVKEAM